MQALKRSIAAFLLVSVAAGLLPLQAQAHRIIERVHDPSTGESDRHSVAHRHRWDGTVVILEDSYAPGYYDNYSYHPSTYRTYGCSPYYDSYRYDGDGHRYRSGGSRVGSALLGAGIGYAIGRSTRRR